MVAAGNEGGDKIHAGGNVTSVTQTVTFNVPTGTSAVFLDIWYDGQDSFVFGFQMPGGQTLTSVDPGEAFPQDPNAASCINGTNTCYNVSHTVTQTTNSSKEVFLVLVPVTGQTIDAGTWIFTLSGTTVNVGTFDAWIVCSGASCDFPAGDDNKTIGEPGVAKRAITAGAHVTKWCWDSIDTFSYCYTDPAQSRVNQLSSFSSLGPTRDGRQKPDIAAPGQGIMSTKSKDASYSNVYIEPSGTHALQQGTSMASPHVAGAVALLLSQNPTLTAEQIKAILQDHAVKDAFTGALCNNTWGCGKMNIAAVGAVTPTAPGLLAPPDNATVASDTPLFDWDPSSGDIRSYRLRVTSGDIGQGLYDLDVVVNPATEYQVTSADALADASYTWNVIARDVLLNTASSPTRTFAVGPKTLTVTKTGDTSDGLCNADCSLREAIAAALSGDKVAVPAGTYTLTLGTELTIAKNLTLNGAGSGDTIIQAATSSADATSRVFNITSGNVAISGVAIQNGRHGTLGSFSGSGGGILQTSGGTLTLTNVTVSGNTAGVGRRHLQLRWHGDPDQQHRQRQHGVQRRRWHLPDIWRHPDPDQTAPSAATSPPRRKPGAAASTIEVARQP